MDANPDADAFGRLCRALARLQAYAARRDPPAQALAARIQASAAALIWRSSEDPHPAEPGAPQRRRITDAQLLEVAQQIEAYLAQRELPILEPLRAGPSGGVRAA